MCTLKCSDFIPYYEQIEYYVKHDSTVSSLYAIDFDQGTWIFLLGRNRVHRSDKLGENMKGVWC
jgi:hypothetical protein